MDLKIKDVAGLLNVSETTIRRWLSDGKIPAYKLNRQYRFSKMEIEKRMMEQKLSGTPSPATASGEQQIFPLPKADVPQSGNQQYALYRALNRGGIHLISGTSKEEVITRSMERIAPELRIDPAVTTDLLLDRERRQTLITSNVKRVTRMPVLRNAQTKSPGARFTDEHADIVAALRPTDSRNPCSPRAHHTIRSGNGSDNKLVISRPNRIEFPVKRNRPRSSETK